MILNSFLIFSLMFSFLQSGSKAPYDFAAIQKQSIEELKIKTEAHKVWGFGKFERWDLDQDVGDLIFSNADGTKAVCPAQIIGSYYEGDHTWLWSWANSSIDEKLTKDALKLKAYGEEHHIERLTTGKWVGTKDDAWVMAALAVKICNEQGAYAPSIGEQTTGYIVFGEVRLSKK
ncbi:MAG TPA: hypothetical protein VFC63_09355 [Blastocatellia bacterium]|nr:hypothetical protein [Blastocatellia bacterium]